MNWKPTTLKVIISLVIAIIVTWLINFPFILQDDIVVGLVGSFFNITPTLKDLIFNLLIVWIVVYSLYSLIQKKK